MPARNAEVAKCPNILLTLRMPAETLAYYIAFQLGVNQGQSRFEIAISFYVTASN